MPVAAFTHFINFGTLQYGTFPDPGGTLSWTGGLDIPLATAVEVDSGPDGLLSIGGEDFVASNLNPYSGYTVEFNGETYAIFSGSNGTLIIPYNKDVFDIAPLATGSNTATYMPTNAMVFNCFATGTTILTPDGERAIETLQPGDRVVTHDGRSTPVIWVARQTVANPRGVELGRRPVRIDAGALGPDLPNGPLTTPCCSATCWSTPARWRRTELRSASCRFRTCRRNSSGGMWSLRTTRSFWPTAAFPRKASSIMSAGPASTITTNISTLSGPTV